jgi:hypothetical protein
MQTLRTLVLAFVVAASPLLAAAQMPSSDAEFAADFVQSGPGGQSSEGRIYVSEGRMRIEMQDGEIVQIVDPTAGRSYVVFPERKQYMEQRLPAQAAGSESMSPCAGRPGWTCKKVGTKKLFGRKAEHWVFEGEREGRSVVEHHWIDAERGLALKQDLGGGMTMENRIVGTEILNGRMVEKWRQIVTVPGQEPMTSLQWYDPKLGMIVREERDGQWRELRNIEVGSQSTGLFRPPRGYTRVTQPPGGGKGPGGYTP